MRFPVIAVVAATLVAPVARAEEAAAPRARVTSGPTVTLAPEVLVFADGAGDWGGVLSLRYRATRDFSIGSFAGIYASPPEGACQDGACGWREDSAARLGGDVRHHIVVPRGVDFWQEVAVGVMRTRSVHDGSQPHRDRFAPTMGIGIGLDFALARYVAIGAYMKLLGAAFSTTPPDGDHHRGFSPALVWGAALSMHLPIAELQ